MRRQRNAWISITVAFLFSLTAARGQAPAEKLQPSEAFVRAEKKYDGGDLLEAERLYRIALGTPDAKEKQRTYDRLMQIYARLGRADQGVQIGKEFGDWLRRGANPALVRDVDLRLGECYLSLGHYRDADGYFERCIAGDEASALPPIKRLTALINLARSAETRKDPTRAARFWKQVEELAAAQLSLPRDVSPAQRIEYTWKLADSYRFQDKPDKAIARLTPLLLLHDQLRDPPGRRDTLRMIAMHQAALGKLDEAEKTLREALELHEKSDPADRMTHGDLLNDLSDVVTRLRRNADAEKLRTAAATDYDAVLRDPKAGKPAAASAINVFWKLQLLYQKSNQYRKALQLTEAQSEQWSSSLIESKLKSERGTLQVILGTYGPARKLLQEAVADLEKQTPPNLLELPRALNNLGVVEEASGNVAGAEQLAERCAAIYRKHDLPDDLILVETFNLLGTCAAQQGRYAVAVERFREGVRRCEKLGTTTEAQQSNLHLNLALLHKSQGDITPARVECARARELYARFAEPESIGFAIFDAALAGMAAAEGKIPEAAALAPNIFALCQKHEINGGVLIVTAKHCLALNHLLRREFDRAEKTWGEALEIQEKEKAPLLIPRTLNYLGLSAELRGKLDLAEKLYVRARDMQKGTPRAFPATHFVTLWRLALVSNRGGKTREARDYLTQALDVVEATRLQTYGDAQQRTTFFGQFGPGFDQLVDWCARDGDIEAALTVTGRGRSRALLDQLQLANVDPRVGIPEPRGGQLRKEEAELRQKISAIRARAQLIPMDAVEQEKGKQLLAALDLAQKDYAEVWREILNASPVYRNLALQDKGAVSVAALQERVLGPKTVLLVYHLGGEQSHLFLVPGDKTKKPEAFALKVSADIATRLAPPEQPPAGSGLAARRRGLIIKKLREQPETPAPATLPPVKETVPLNQALARDLIDHYLHLLIDDKFKPTRGFKLTPKKLDDPIPTQRLDLLGDMFLPAEARKRIKEMAPEALLVVPDGPLHKLPMEALLVDAGDKPRYVLDEMPPIVYAPSVSVLGFLASRPAVAANKPLSLLTASNPAYPQGKEPVKVPTPERAPVLGLRGQFDLLPQTAKEAERIRQQFDRALVTAFAGEGATEKAVAGAVAGKRVVHIAAHGFADDRLGNLFGALALTPPAPGKETADDDGFLSLHEIYSLPLADCDLAILSACETNFGPQRPLEAGVTLASGFLAAGARRVVASHWDVDDESTAELMGTFIAEVTTAAKRGQKASYTAALQKARLAVRNKPDWAAPYYWAPFVLIGPAE